VDYAAHIAGNKGCGVWMMSSSLPHLVNNQISHNSIYGVAVLCGKDDTAAYPPGQGASESFQEEREGAGAENDSDSEEEHPAARHPVSVALVELNSINHNGGELAAQGSSWALGEGVAFRMACCPGPPALGLTGSSSAATRPGAPWRYGGPRLECGWVFVLKLPVRITESQDGRGWKRALLVTQSNPPAEAGSPTAGCTGSCPGRS